MPLPLRFTMPGSLSAVLLVLLAYPSHLTDFQRHLGFRASQLRADLFA
jgi:hypothetical protein